MLRIVSEWGTARLVEQLTSIHQPWVMAEMIPNTSSRWSCHLDLIDSDAVTIFDAS